MAETAPVTHYVGKKRKKPAKTALRGYGGGHKKKFKTGGTKHVVASTGGSL